jgi:diaminohydroxyphosphoribosylaminopyrimidine deaminase/5-amino-6-(5-phosphoribosylamino)uracil reductase
MTSPAHTTFMERALELAALGGRAVMPNPMVGAVVVVDGKIVGEGYHHFYGGPHAEVAAIQSVGDPHILKRATLYVSLEPCSHFGKTPPCADLIIRSQIPTVVVGCRDPFPAVSGRGIQNLKEAGISVVEDVLHDECVDLNRRFMVAHQRKRPYVILKWAETTDGFIARSDYSSKWISCDASRTLTHRWRSEEMSILVGSVTARVDDPELTVRHVTGTNPLRVTVDNNLSLPSSHKLFNDTAETLVFNLERNAIAGRCTWKKYDPNPAMPIAIVQELYALKITSLIVEGGARTLQSFIDLGLWDEARVFISPQTFRLGIKAPLLPSTSTPSSSQAIDTDTLLLYRHSLAGW